MPLLDSEYLKMKCSLYGENTRKPNIKNVQEFIVIIHVKRYDHRNHVFEYPSGEV